MEDFSNGGGAGRRGKCCWSAAAAAAVEPLLGSGFNDLGSDVFLELCREIVEMREGERAPGRARFGHRMV